MKDSYTPTIGLEIHTELRTRSKMFCGCENAPHTSEPNSRICPVCTAQPGSLPVINREAVKHVLRVGVALGGELADVTEFDRKNYFYPDIPKGYQISQYDHPLVRHGELAGVEITRVHLEEDTGRSVHDEGDYSLVDYNRAGVPLMELVTEPVIHDAETAGRFARELQLLLRYLGVAEANMERGEMRVEANISVSKEKGVMGTKTEVKNLNSFRSVERAIAYEVERQVDILESGKEVIQETRGWDEDAQTTFSQREKEESHDYRYFPDPDIPKLNLSLVEDFSKEALLEEQPELPDARRARYAKLGIPEESTETLVNDPELAAFFDAAAEALGKEEEKIRLLVNYITSDLQGLRVNYTETELSAPDHMAKLIEMVHSGDLSSRGAKDTLVILMQEKRDPEDIATEHGFLQQSDKGTLEAVVDEVIKEHTDVVEDYRSGNEKVLQFLVGQGMKKTKGAANPSMLAELLKQKLT